MTLSWDVSSRVQFDTAQRCRQGRDALLGAEKKMWWETSLAPVIGTEKAAMINEGIRALNHMGNEASHGANIEVDRDVADYVIGSMTLILYYEVLLSKVALRKGRDKADFDS